MTKTAKEVLDYLVDNVAMIKGRMARSGIGVDLGQEHNNRFRDQALKELEAIHQQEIAKAKRQTAYDIITQFKADRVNHTLGTPVTDWEREFETADKTLEQYIKAETLKEHIDKF